MEPVIACDRCIKDRVRCRFNPLSQSSCRGCIALDIPCNWTHTSKPRPPPDISYIKYIEARTKLAETHLKNLLGINTKKDIDALLEKETSDASQKRAAPAPGLYEPPKNLSRLRPGCLDSPALARLVQQIRLLDIEPIQDTQNIIDDNTLWLDESSRQPHERAFHGYSSAQILSRDAATFRLEHDAGDPQPFTCSLESQYLPELWRSQPGTKRQQDSPATGVIEHSLGELPPADLMPILLDAFFDNAFFPVVHRGLFEKQLGEGLHKHQPSFLRLVFLVCANGARWCNDPRVLDERWPVPLSAGYRWFRQLDLWPRNVLVMPQLTLWDAQSLVLSALYLCSSSATYGAWVTIGTAIRMMQDIGSHRKRSSQTLENELHKRCYWSMLLLDRFYSANFGRNAATFDWDSDLENVLEVDDHLWSPEPTALPPTQPPGVISRLSIFKEIVRLTHLYGRCIQTVVSYYDSGCDIERLIVPSRGPQGSAWAFNDINIRLKDWARSLPSTLQPPRPQNYNNSPFCFNLLTMWAIYYEFTIAANRPFITRTSPLADPSLKICRKTAREFASMAASYAGTPGSRLIPGMIYPAFSCAMILVIDLIAEADRKEGEGANHPTPFTQGSEKEASSRQQKEADLRTCINVLERAESRIHMAGRLRDIVRDFEASLWLHSATNTIPNSPDYVPLANEVGDTNLDIHGPPEIPLVENNTQCQSQGPIDSPPGFSSFYEFAEPYFQSSGYLRDHEHSRSHPTLATMSPQIIHPQPYSMTPIQPFNSHMDPGCMHPCSYDLADYPPGHPEEIAWSYLSTVVQPNHTSAQQIF